MLISLKNNIDLKVLLDQDGSVTQTYGAIGFPTTFIINVVKYNNVNSNYILSFFTV